MPYFPVEKTLVLDHTHVTNTYLVQSAVSPVSASQDT